MPKHLKIKEILRFLHFISVLETFFCFIVREIAWVIFLWKKSA